MSVATSSGSGSLPANPRFQSVPDLTNLWYREQTFLPLNEKSPDPDKGPCHQCNMRNLREGRVGIWRVGWLFWHALRPKTEDTKNRGKKGVDVWFLEPRFDDNVDGCVEPRKELLVHQSLLHSNVNNLGTELIRLNPRKPMLQSRRERSFSVPGPQKMVLAFSCRLPQASKRSSTQHEAKWSLRAWVRIIWKFYAAFQDRICGSRRLGASGEPPYGYIMSQRHLSVPVRRVRIASPVHRKSDQPLVSRAWPLLEARQTRRAQSREPIIAARLCGEDLGFNADTRVS